jgi:hypothetical protein
VGCSSACQDLGDRICNCEAEGQVRKNCQANVKARVGAANASTSDQAYCESLLATCPDPAGDIEACAYLLNTCPGRVGCGQALPGPGGGDGCTAIVVPTPPPASALDAP